MTPAASVTMVRALAKGNHDHPQTKPRAPQTRSCPTSDASRLALLGPRKATGQGRSTAAPDIMGTRRPSAFSRQANRPHLTPAQRQRHGTTPTWRLHTPTRAARAAHYRKAHTHGSCAACTTPTQHSKHKAGLACGASQPKKKPNHPGPLPQTTAAFATTAAASCHRAVFTALNPGLAPTHPLAQRTTHNAPVTPRATLSPWFLFFSQDCSFNLVTLNK